MRQPESQPFLVVEIKDPRFTPPGEPNIVGPWKPNLIEETPEVVKFNRNPFLVRNPVCVHQTGKQVKGPNPIDDLLATCARVSLLDKAATAPVANHAFLGSIIPVFES